MMRTVQRNPVAPARWLIGFLAALALGACGESPPPAPSAPKVAVFSGNTMGTTYTVKVVVPALTEAEQTAVRTAIQAALDDVDQRMSTYKPDSELSRFNRHRGREPFALSQGTIAVFLLARDVSEATGGAFDVTVGPLVNAWGFGPVKQARPPTEAELARIRPDVGYRLLKIDTAAGTIAKARPGVYADLSAIAKGYAVDQVAQALDARGFGRYMVEVGGEVRVRGENGTGRPWQVGIERPDEMGQRAQLVVPMTHLAMATSGDYRIYFEREGRRYSHEIDPISGEPIRHRLASVTVLAPDCALADAYATALLVLGPELGYALALEKGLAAYFIERRPEGGFAERQTPGFAKLTGNAMERP
jgi:thiamine biosynthesis lipoprotein